MPEAVGAVCIPRLGHHLGSAPQSDAEAMPDKFG
jgi:hypothetical protein